jgi:50S ribosomal subunit-associated GTPase HflX
VSAITGEGRDELIAAMEGRLALDTAHVTLEFDAGEAARERIAQLYRIGRILRHVSVDGRVLIEAEIPRRVLDQFAASHKATEQHGLVRP